MRQSDQHIGERVESVRLGVTALRDGFFSASRMVHDHELSWARGLVREKLERDVLHDLMQAQMDAMRAPAGHGPRPTLALSGAPWWTEDVDAGVWYVYARGVVASHTAQDTPVGGLALLQAVHMPWDHRAEVEVMMRVGVAGHVTATFRATSIPMLPYADTMPMWTRVS